MSEEYERRAFDCKVEFRAAPEGSASPGTLAGYAFQFNKESRDLGGWFEVIDPGAAGDADEDGQLDMERHTRVLARSEHDSRHLLGTTDAGTLRLYLDNIGLRYEVDLPNTNAGRDAATLAERGDYRYSSFAFYTLPGGTEWRENAQGMLVRHVTALKLVDVAPVADPAYWSSSTELQRSFDLDAVRASLRSNEEDLPEPEAAPNARAAALGRAKQIQLTLEGGRK